MEKGFTVAPDLYEISPLKDDPKQQKRYRGKIGRPIKRKDPKPVKWLPLQKNI